MTEHEKGHIPYPCLLLHYLEEWKKDHEGTVPSSYKEKTDFRSLIQAAEPNEENFTEACAAVLKSLNPAPSLPAVSKAPEAQTESLNSESSAFWILANAVAQFCEKNGGQLPLPGAVPDMKAQSKDYIELQNIYKSKARADAAEILAIVRQTEERVQRPRDLAVKEKEVEEFCKLAAHVQVVRGRPIGVVDSERDLGLGDERKEELAREIEMGMAEEKLMHVYCAFRGWDAWVAKHNPNPSSSSSTSTKQAASKSSSLRIPGAQDDTDLETDTDEVTALALGLIDSLLDHASLNTDSEIIASLKDQTAKVCKELVRAGGGELHNIASMTGGMVAQEVLKVLTGQYGPVDNTVMVDGVGSRVGVLRV